MAERLRPGQPAPRSGQYEIIARNGRRTGAFRRGLRNKPLPPTPKPSQSYEFVSSRRSPPRKKRR